MKTGSGAERSTESGLARFQRRKSFRSAPAERDTKQGKQRRRVPTSGPESRRGCATRSSLRCSHRATRKTAIGRRRPESKTSESRASSVVTEFPRAAFRGLYRGYANLACRRRCRRAKRNAAKTSGLLRLSGFGDRHRSPACRSHRDPLVVIVREAALEVGLEFGRAAAHMP